ncbi:hypothetical protein TorRG33x02_185720 [Trema orientale]|uniref:Uncharacterized protein n=1 Tax=Trema orientale TaxID=63057 RepID=A0A2P5EJ38_TREOI|nr:hypothetical protein TorRG33x02_185720 [Trema orientale]
MSITHSHNLIHAISMQDIMIISVSHKNNCKNATNLLGNSQRTLKAIGGESFQIDGRDMSGWTRKRLTHWQRGARTAGGGCNHRRTLQRVLFSRSFHCTWVVRPAALVSSPHSPVVEEWVGQRIRPVLLPMAGILGRIRERGEEEATHLRRRKWKNS